MTCVACFRHPTLVIWGAEDAIIPAAHAEGVEAEVLVVPGVGHMVQMEAADQANPAAPGS